MNRRLPRWRSRAVTAGERPRRRALLGAVATAVVLAGLPLAPSVRAERGGGEARGVATACPPDQVDSAGFTDVAGEGEGQRAAIDCIAAHGVTKGTSATTYDPGGTVTRAQMASFVMRTLDRVEGYERPADAPNAFADDDADIHHDDINDGAAEDVIRGRADGTYGADGSVTRAQMASFVVRVLEAAGAAVPADAPDAFGDDAGDTHEGAIDALAALHVVVGTAAGTYGPGAAVTRSQMALFLGRSLDLLTTEGLVSPFAGPTVPSGVVATTIGASAVKVRWLAPASGTPTGYDLHRRSVATPTTTCPTTGYTKVGSVDAPARQLDDIGLTVDITYCYRVAARSGTGSGATTSELSPPSAAARATTSNVPRMVSGVADTGAETVTITYDQRVNCTDTSRRQFAYGASTSTAPTKAACPGGPTLVLTFGNVIGAGDLTYAQDTAPAVRVKNDTGTVAVTPQTIAVVDPPPRILSAEADTSADEVTVTYSELVSCVAASASQFTYKVGAAVKPTKISGCVTARAATVVLKFDGGQITGPGTLTYTESGDPTLRITDAGAKQAVSPQPMPDTEPKMVKALATPVPDVDPSKSTTTVVVTYDQAITCPASDDSAGQFSLADATGVATTATTATCASTTPTIIDLTFPGAAGDGALTYAYGGVPANRIKDGAGSPAHPSQSIAADANPFMRFAVLDATEKSLTVTYSEPVTCIPASKERFQFTRTGASTAEKTPIVISCPGPTVVLDFEAVALGTDGKPIGGDLGYTAGSNTALRLKDATGNEAVGQTLDVTPPQFDQNKPLVVTRGTGDGGTVAVDYSEDIRCDTGINLKLFSYTGAAGFPTTGSPTNGNCGGTKLTLTFVLKSDTSGADYLKGDLRLVDGQSGITDLTGNAAKSVDMRRITPSMSSATKTSGNEKQITVTYSEPVTCLNNAESRSQFTYTLATATKPEVIACANITLTLTFEANVIGGGSLAYAEAGGADSVRDDDRNASTSPEEESVAAEPPEPPEPPAPPPPP